LPKVTQDNENVAEQFAETLAAASVKRIYGISATA